MFLLSPSITWTDWRVILFSLGQRCQNTFCFNVLFLCRQWCPVPHTIAACLVTLQCPAVCIANGALASRAISDIVNACSRGDQHTVIKNLLSRRAARGLVLLISILTSASQEPNSRGACSRVELERAVCDWTHAARELQADKRACPQRPQLEEWKRFLLLQQESSNWLMLAKSA